MLWHGNRGLPSRGSGATARVDWHSTHESASPSTGSPARPRTALREAVRVPGPPPAPHSEEAVGALRRLRSGEGAGGGGRAAALQAEGADLLAGLSRLRAEVGPELAGPAWELARLRARAPPGVGADAG